VGKDGDAVGIGVFDGDAVGGRADAIGLVEIRDIIGVKHPAWAAALPARRRGRRIAPKAECQQEQWSAQVSHQGAHS